jgi:formylglycine-generating enzyme required for sulfatase activity
MTEDLANQKLKQLFSSLSVNFGLTGKDIADVLWLALKQQECSASKSEKPANLGENSPTEPNNITEIISDNIPPTIEPATVPKKEPAAKIYPPQNQQTASATKGKTLPLRHTDPPSLREPLEFAKALRPLIRPVDSGRKTILDEVKTVNRTAEEGICIPVLKSEPEPWLDLALVVDENSSMVIWGHPIKELQRILEHYGIFREVRTWGLTTDKQKKIIVRAKFSKQQLFKDPQELIDPTNRRLILIVSDCVAQMWFDGQILSTLQDWTKHQPLAIIQMLPDSMWLRSGLRLGAGVKLANLIPGIANRNLRIKELLLWKDFNLQQGSKIPILTLEPDRTSRWSEFLVGKHDQIMPGFIFPSKSDFIPPPKLPQNQVSQLTAAQRVERFRKISSPWGRKLAGLLMAAPVITLPVVRLIQKTLLPESLPVHVAEVFLGGLLKSLTEITTETNPDGVLFDVMEDEIRDILLDDAPFGDSQFVFETISNYIEKQLGKSLRECVALLKIDSEDESETNTPEKAYAQIGLKVLKGLGGTYAKFANEIEKFQPQTEDKQPPTTPTLEIPELETFEFEAEVATIVFEDETTEKEEKLQQWTFETPTVNRGGETIKTTTYTAFYFTETLSEGVELEMVAIPGGTFTMGSPKSEEGSHSDERRQHNVTLSPFFMGKYPITQAQWKEIASRTDLKVKRNLNPDPSRFKKPYQDIDRWQRPVENVSWYDAVEFCQRLSQLTGRVYRLPSEAQWEYACRGVTKSLNLESGESYPPFYFGETITADLANYDASITYADAPEGEESKETTPVGQFPPNAFGLYDMHGNVWEWCLDDWHGNYENAPTDGSAWTDINEQENVNGENEPNSAKNDENESYSPLRGGSWLGNPYNCRSAFRSYINRRDDRYYYVGFRVVCESGRTL